MSAVLWQRKLADENCTIALGAELALMLQPGDFIALKGDLGTGKTALARAIIRACGLAEDEDVPSPTFTLVQSYEHIRIPVWHFDLYRIEAPEEIFELGFEEAEDSAICLVEWPEKMARYLPANYLEICLEHAGPGRRALLRAHGNWKPRLERARLLHDFLAKAGWQAARREHLQGDASSRSYQKLFLNGCTRVLMNAPPCPGGPPLKDGKTYSELARLAGDMTSFSAIAAYLRRLGLSAPQIYAGDLINGFLLLEYLGDEVFSRRIAAGKPMSEPYNQAIAVLHVLHSRPPPEELPLEQGAVYIVPQYDEQVFLTELELLIEWYWPHIHGAAAPREICEQYMTCWQSVLQNTGAAKTLVLRDYHSPNLLWLAEREGVARAGLIDFQDALIGPPAYDLASLLQDARIDVPQSRESTLLQTYMEGMGLSGPEREVFLRDYAILGAQRAAKILGIFARLANRDAKPAYLQHMPRVEEYLERNLRHPALAPVKKWFDCNLPLASRIA